NRRRRRRRALWHRTARWCPTAVAAPPDRAGSPRYRCRTPRSWCPWPSHPGRRRSRRPGSVRRVPRRSPDPASTRWSTPRGPVPGRPHRTGTTATLPWQEGRWCSWHDFTHPAQPHGTTWHLAPRAGGYGMGVSIRLIATDLDGTLLTDPTTISPRNLAALDAARAFGMEVVPVTARQPPGLRPVADICGFTAWALCGNGTQAIHLGTGESLFAAELDAVTGQAVAAALLDRLPGVMFASVRDGGRVFVAEAAYAEASTFSDHKRDVTDMTIRPRH